MFPVTERHGADLPSRYRRCPCSGGRADSTSGSSRDGTHGEIDAPAAIIVRSHTCNASGAEQFSATISCDNRLSVQANRDNGLGTTPLSALVREQTKHENRSGMPNRSGLRAQALDELLASIHEYRAASPAFRHFWRVVALHNIARFKRDWIQPERAAFLAAVAASKLRRAA